MVESEERERSLAFNIMEIQPFHHPAAIQAMSLDAERVSLPTPLYPMELPSDGQLRTELLCMRFACPFKSLWAPGLRAWRVAWGLRTLLGLGALA